MPENDDYSFTYKYHLDTIDKKKALLNEDGSVTTVKTIGVPYKGRIYNIPSYDNKTGRLMSEEEAFKKFRKNIEAGEVESFPIEFQGNIQDHPANVAARAEHLGIEADNERAMEAIGYGKK